MECRRLRRGKMPGPFDHRICARRAGNDPSCDVDSVGLEDHAAARPRDAVKPWLATNPDYANKGLLTDENYWTRNLKPLSERWAQWKLS